MRPFTKVLLTGLAALVGASWGMGSAVAGDKMRVCVVELEGARNRDLQNDLADAIRQSYQILGDSTFYKAAKRMRMGKPLAPANLKRLAKFLRLGAVIDGTLVAKRGKYELLLKVRDARTGAISERIRHTLRKPRITKNELTRIRRDMINALERIRLDDGGATSGPGPAAKPKKDDFEDLEEEDLEEEEITSEIVEARPKPKTRAERRAEARRKAKEAREARRQVALEKKRKAREAREARKKAAAEKKRKAQEERLARRRAAQERRRAAREERERKRRAAARGGGRSDEEDLDDLDEEDLEEEDLDDLEEDDLEEEEELDDREIVTASAEDDKEDGGKGSGGSATASVASKSAASSEGAGDAMVANAGLGFTSRNLTFDASSAMNQPIDYAGGFAPSAFVDFELYPMAFGGGSGLLSNIGIDARFEQALILESTVDPDGGDAGNAFNVDTTFRRYGVGLRYRHMLGSLTVAARVGYGSSTFELDKPEGMEVDIPNVAYTFADPGLGLVYSMGKLAFGAHVRFLAILGTGEIQELEQYGQAKILAFDGDIGADYALTSSIGLRLGARLAQLQFTFAGNGALNDRDGDGEQDVAGATDRYLGGYLTGFYRF
jgi:hypothetical protein